MENQNNSQLITLESILDEYTTQEKQQVIIYLMKSISYEDRIDVNTVLKELKLI